MLVLTNVSKKLKTISNLPFHLTLDKQKTNSTHISIFKNGVHPTSAVSRLNCFWETCGRSNT